MPYSREPIAVFEPTWLSFGRNRPIGVPDRAFTWLRDQGSLTQRVIDACEQQFRVRLQHQGWGVPTTSERRLLRMGRARSALVREVELHCGFRPWVFARTVIPAQSLRGGARRLARLGEKPLGAVLFADPSTRRERIELAKLLPGQTLFETAIANLEQRPEQLWGRRTLFYYADQPLLVNEIFLPDIVDG